MATPSSSPGARRSPWGALPDGTAIEAVELDNGRGLSARILTLGATLQALGVPDRRGIPDDIVLGYDSAAEYLAGDAFFGGTIGRYANRIARGRFALDGDAYQLDTNDGPNHLHGGRPGFHKHVWEIVETGGGLTPFVQLHHLSPNGDGGYPGALDVTARYRLDADSLTIEYRADTDRPTIVNLTNHSYFNLAGTAAPRDILDHRLTIAAQRYTPVDGALIPTGELRPVSGSPFDFRNPTAIGARISDDDAQLAVGGGYDHNFRLDEPWGPLRLAVRLEDPASGRVMEMLTGAPGLQFYSGNVLDGSIIGKGGRAYRRHDALCLEPQTFPDSPNRPEFPSPRLDPGETYIQRIVLRFPEVPQDG